MKRVLITAIFSLFATCAAAGDITIDLEGVTLPSLTKAVLTHVADASLIVAPDAFNDERKIGVRLKQATVAQTVSHLQKIAASMGYALAENAGVFYLGQVKEDSEMIVYTPKAKSTAYLLDLVNGMFSGVVSANSRPIEMSGQPQSAMNHETGTNAASLISKGPKEALVLMVPKSKTAMVHALLDQVDIAAPEIEVKAMLLEVQKGKSEASAINFVLGLLGGKLGLEWSGGADQGRGVSVKIGSIDALWSAIETDRRFKVISSPRLRVKSGASARFSVGSEVPVLGAVTYQQGGQAVQSVEYKPAGVILDLLPEIHKDFAEITIRQQLSNFVKTETGVNNSPTLLKRELSTVVTARRGEVVFLGGLNEIKETFDRSGFFFLPPFLHSRAEDSSNTEILMLLHVEKLGTEI